MKLPRWVSVFISMSIRYYCISVGRHARGFLGIPGHLGTVLAGGPGAGVTSHREPSLGFARFLYDS